MTDPQQGKRPTSGGAAVFQRMRAIGRRLGDAEEFETILERMKDARTGSPSVVMVGEISRGKSTLVNALIGQPGLAPVEASETTALVVNFAPTTGERPAGTAVLEFEREPAEREIPLPDLARWVTVEGDEILAADPPPRQATVHVDSWLLPQVVIVDTPGTGGLSEAYARRAFDRAERASILVLVTDAGGRISSHALEFLDRCSESVAEVVIVVNKIDAHRGTWESILEENRAIIESAHPRLAKAPILGISARWAEQAALEADPERRAKLLERSRVQEFTSVIQSVLERADELPAANALRQAQSALRPRLETRIAERQALVAAGGAKAEQEEAGDAELLRAKEKREELLLTFDDAKYDWPAAIEDLRGELNADASARCRRFQNFWKDKVESQWNGLTKEKALVFQNELDAALEVEMVQHIQKTVVRCAELVKWLYAEAGLTPSPELLQTFGARRNDWRGQRHERFERQGQKLDARSLIGGAMQGVSISRILLLGASAAVSLPAVLGVGALMGGITIWSGKRKQQKQIVLQVIGDRTAEMRELLDRFSRKSVTLVQTEAKKQFDRDLKKSVAAAKEEVQRLQQAKAATAEERQKRMRELEPEIAELRQALADADREIAKLGSGRRG